MTPWVHRYDPRGKLLADVYRITIPNHELRYPMGDSGPIFYDGVGHTQSAHFVHIAWWRGYRLECLGEPSHDVPSEPEEIATEAWQ